MKQLVMKQMVKQTINLATLLGATLALTACAISSQEGPSNMGKPGVVTQDNQENLMSAILNEIGAAKASELSQCKVLPVGQRPCGGPARYLAYSTITSDQATLEMLAQRYNALSAELNEQEGLMSTCEVMPEPTVQLVNGQCTISQSASQ
ncbi:MULTISPECIES: hypothetical protein [Gammaproteobacteria]|uniref:hypothetical protein n=1 Tax=Gammaproteobacteria TaxID=1236 RepID=UPI000DD0B8CC|nr:MULTISPECIES: hypothetical protein [Gammaproteobacteria]RTE87492.1 hypothetical protein DQX04_03685 [Aliidiomarina sp. B3213]TCZ92723.1 hypothetical protein EYQ95_01620 [Lysobacter sp. N42]